MKREIIKTGDGSSTIYLPEWNEHYHSRHGAIQEALHVFIKSGFDHVVKEQASPEISILEIGFGTGLNALVTLLAAEKVGLQIEYTGIEAYPVSSEEIEALDYAAAFSEENSAEVFENLHSAPWEKTSEIMAFFRLQKKQMLFDEIADKEKYDLIYFDAFGPRIQPDLWTETIFQKMYDALLKKGILVTYSSKGDVRRVMQAVGFTVERLPGPPGKREMLRATKP